MESSSRAASTDSTQIVDQTRELGMPIQLDFPASFDTGGEDDANGHSFENRNIQRLVPTAGNFVEQPTARHFEGPGSSHLNPSIQQTQPTAGYTQPTAGPVQHTVATYATDTLLDQQPRQGRLVENAVHRIETQFASSSRRKMGVRRGQRQDDRSTASQMGEAFEEVPIRDEDVL